MKQNIIILTLGLCIGMLVFSGCVSHNRASSTTKMINQVCKQKDSMIRLLINNSDKIENISDIPKNLPIVNIK